MPTLVLVLLLALVAGCGEPRPTARIGGDPDGVPVTVTIVYDDQALTAIAQGGGFTRTVVVDRGYSPFVHPHFHHHHHGYGHPGHLRSHAWASEPYAYEPSTTLSLLIGDGPAEAQLLRARLSAGTTAWTMAMRPGRTAVVSLHASGGREGWREIGRFTAAERQRVTVHLEGAQARMVVEPATATGIPGQAPTAEPPIAPAATTAVPSAGS
jgi:hypothetical protein